MTFRKVSAMWMLLLGLLTVTTWQMGLAAEAAHASAARRPGGGFLVRMDRSVGLTPEQRDAIRGLLAQQRQQSQALRDQTDGKIRGMLTPDQQKKFDDFLAQLKNSQGWHPSAAS